jgi:hypothetical protein
LSKASKQKEILKCLIIMNINLKQPNILLQFAVNTDFFVLYQRAFDALCHSTHLYGRRLVLEWADSEDNIDQLRQKTAKHFFNGLLF